MTRLFYVFVLVLAVLLIPLLALAQASQPTSAPAVSGFLAWWSVWWPAVILPTLLVALASAITLLRKRIDDPTAQKVAGWLELVSEFLSIFGRRGSGQALKSPFSLSRRHKEMKKAVLKTPPAALLLIFLLPFVLGSCCILKPGTCKTAYGNCAAEMVRAEFPDALNLVEAALSGSTPEIVTHSLDLLLGLGKGLILCCVESVREKYAPATQPASAPAALKANPKALRIYKNANLYLKAKGVKP